jgi:hypothetical protein
LRIVGKFHNRLIARHNVVAFDDHALAFEPGLRRLFVAIDRGADQLEQFQSLTSLCSRDLALERRELIAGRFVDLVERLVRFARYFEVVRRESDFPDFFRRAAFVGRCLNPSRP